MKKIYLSLSIIVMFFLIISIVYAEDLNKLEKGKLRKDKEIQINDNILENEGKGKIKFKNSFDVEIEDVSDNPNVYISDNLIALKSDELPELNQPATITFYNLFFKDIPVIYYNKGFTTNPGEITKPCPEDICSNINYDKETGTLSFDVAHFTSFYAAPSWSKSGWQNGLWPQCSGNEECKPTAYCAKFSVCDSIKYDPYYPYFKEEMCYYDPPAGTKTQHSLYAWNYFYPDPWDGICDEGYKRRLCSFEYGFIYGCFSDRTCAKIETCEDESCTCEDTPACNLDPQADKRESHYCQPKVCDAEDIEVGQCYYEGDEYTPEQNVPIGGKVCANKEKWQVCAEEDGDPCGEWYISNNESIITTTDMYGLDYFDVDVCAGNSVPEINIDIGSNENPNVCDNLVCKAEINDDCSSSFEVEYKITGGHGSLAETMPEIEGITTCLGNPCEVKINIPKQYTLCDDEIKCEIKAKDECAAANIQVADSNTIKGVNSCAA